MTNKCCPRVRVVCKRPKSTKVSATYYAAPSYGDSPLTSAPKHKTAHVTVHHESLCSVKLGGETLVSGVKVDDERLQKAISRANEKRVAKGCVADTVNLPSVTPPKSENYPDVPSEVVDKLRAKVKQAKK